MMRLSTICQVLQGEKIANNFFQSDVVLSGVTTDSRQDCSKKLFIALPGERFDAHDFVAQALQHSAAAALVERTVAAELPQVRVADTHQALKDLAAWWRSQFAIPVIGVTGSVGKTSVKEMLACIFAQIGAGLVTEGNLNNEIGVPLTLLRLTADDQYAIVEMGMNHAGEIARLTQITKPTVALINNAAAAHLEGLGTVEAVAFAKGEIFAGLSRDGVAVINADDQFAGLWRDLVDGQQVLSFGLDSAADISAEYQLNQHSVRLQVTAPSYKANFKIELNLVGKHNAANALAAIAVALAANVPVAAIKSGLANYRPVAGRLNFTKLANLTLIDDTYNANPASMRAAIEVLAQYPDSTLITGDMGELGSASDYEHCRLGELAAQHGIKRLFAVGDFAEKTIKNFTGESKAFADQQQLMHCLAEDFIRSGTILVKGSRSAKMERVVERIIQLHKAENRISPQPDSTNRNRSVI